MAKEKNKSPKKASNIFHSVMSASVSGNPKRRQNKKKITFY